jgi:hypothetical protein
MAMDAGSVIGYIIIMLLIVAILVVNVYTMKYTSRINRYPAVEATFAPSTAEIKTTRRY